MMAWQERLEAFSWAVAQALPWWLVLGALTWAGYQWPLPLPPRWREGITLGLLLSYTWWRSRPPWNRVLLALLAWCIGTVWKLYPAPSWTVLGGMTVVLSGLAWLAAFLRPHPGPWWPVGLFLLWAVYTGVWLYGWWSGVVRSTWWYKALGVATFFLLLVEGWAGLLREARARWSGVAAGDLYVALSVLVWLIAGI